MPLLQPILDHIAPALLVVFRIGGLMMYGPVFGSSAIPMRVRVFLSFVVGVAIYGVVGAQQSAALKLELWTLAPLVALEMMIGLIIGYLASLPLLALQAGGLIMGQQMGLGFAQLYNPAIEDEADIVGQMLFFMILASFLVAGGHEWMMLAVMHSFHHVPLGGFVLDQNVVHLFAGLLTASLELAIRVAAPLLAIVFLETVAMGYLAKTVPQLNILSLGFPLRILAGIGVTALGLVIINDVGMESISSTMSAIFDWISDRSAPGALSEAGGSHG
jgi:flagellar biosynthetic protein FliR